MRRNPEKYRCVLPASNRGVFRLSSRSITWLSLLAAVLTGVPAAFSAVPDAGTRVQSGERTILGGSIKIVASAGASAKAGQAGITSTQLDAAETGKQITFEVALRLRQPEVLRAQQAAGLTASPEELEINHLPVEADFNATADWLTSQGFTVVNRDAHRLAIFARGTVAQVQAAFQTQFARVSFEGKSYLAAVKAPSVPSTLTAVAGVLGLQPYHRAHPFFHMPAVQPATNNAPPYLVSELLGAYNAKSTTLTGAGQMIGIIIDVPPLSADLTKFWTDNHINQTLSRISTEDTSTTGTVMDDPSGEETLDVSWSSGIAPQAQVRVFASGDLSFVNIDNTYSSVASELKAGSLPALHQISLSFGSDEDATTSDELDLDHSYFATIASYGVSIFVSSGDNGAFNSNFGRSVSTPASDPSVTAVGGTSLVLNTSTGAVTSESAWTSDGQGFSDGRIAASGGGISGYFPHPSWQTGSTVPAGYNRLVPDVASSADQNQPGYLVLTLNGTQYSGGYANGTSWAAPTWVGLCALLNQARANGNLAPLGFLNPKLYPLVGTDSFRDITTGDNQYPGYPGYGFDAKTGYDMVTGLGTANFANLVKALVPATVPVITSATTATATQNKAFSYKITATNSPMKFAASGLPTGLTINTTTGLISGTPKNVGRAAVTISATNASGTGSARLTITIQAPPVVTSATTASAKQSKSFTYQITATNSPTSYGATGLPSGLTINTSTGVISGAPKNIGKAAVTITVTNAAGTGTGKVTITITAS